MLPAWSLTDAVAVSAVPAPVITESGGQATTPESASLQAQWMTTLPWYQPSAFGLVVGTPVSVGAVWSTLMPAVVAVAVFPAASLAVPLTDWLRPSPTFCAAEQVSTPESASPQTDVTVTGALYHPSAFGERSRETETVGFVLSMLTNAGSEAVFPALSVAVPMTLWCAPSANNVVEPTQLGIPDTASAHANVTVTSVLFQPLAFASGDCVWLIVGGVLSIFTWIVCAVSTLPAR